MPSKPFEKVIIVGAGPAGLVLAILLARRSIPSLVLEAWPQLDTRLRATQYGVPATRVFRAAGLLDDIRARSIPSFPHIRWWRAADQRELVSIDMACVADHPDRMTIIPLSELVTIMYEHCTKYYSDLVDVRFEHRVATAGQDDGIAWVDAEVGPDKEKKRFEADYVIGCDGASSAVRKSLFGHDWPGQTFEQKIVVQNIWYDGFEKHGWEGGNYIVDGDAWGLVARRGLGGLWRVTYGDVGGLTDDRYLARRPAKLRRMLPGHPEPDAYRISGTNIYNMHNRCVPRMRDRRILLAADAAHVCNPWGGYGCMSAVLDSGALADCLAGFYEGEAGDEILDLYADIRRDKFMRFVDARSVKNMNRLCQSDPWTVLETDKFFGILKELAKDKEALRAFLLKWSSIEYDFTQHYKSREGQGLSVKNTQ